MNVLQTRIGFDDDMRREATVSECRRYRYSLRRTWNESLPSLVLCMLNPSIADALADDPTIRKCIGFAKRMGCGGIVVGNLYAYRATDPRDLRVAGEVGEDIAGPDNDSWFRVLAEIARDSGGNRLLCAWGSTTAGRPRCIHERARKLIAVAQAGIGVRLECLGVTMDGDPRHPLMLPYAAAERVSVWT